MGKRRVMVELVVIAAVVCVLYWSKASLRQLAWTSALSDGVSPPAAQVLSQNFRGGSDQSVGHKNEALHRNQIREEKRSKNNRIILASVPRTGNGWLRGLLEAATGLGTVSVFPESDAVYDNVTQAYGENYCMDFNHASFRHNPVGSFKATIVHIQPRHADGSTTVLWCTPRALVTLLC
jgi:hypothetical protein